MGAARVPSIPVRITCCRPANCVGSQLVGAEAVRRRCGTASGSASACGTSISSDVTLGVIVGELAEISLVAIGIERGVGVIDASASRASHAIRAVGIGLAGLDNHRVEVGGVVLSFEGHKLGHNRPTSRARKSQQSQKVNAGAKSKGEAIGQPILRDGEPIVTPVTTGTAVTSRAVRTLTLAIAVVGEPRICNIVGSNGVEAVGAITTIIRCLLCGDTNIHGPGDAVGRVREILDDVLDGHSEFVAHGDDQVVIVIISFNGKILVTECTDNKRLASNNCGC